MDHEIRYCTAEDGVSIAYNVSGQGDEWLVHTPNALSAAIQYETILGRRAWLDGLGKHFRVVQYDSRGTGFSQRDVDDVSMEAMLLDLEAVADATGANRVNLFGFLVGSYPCVWYAATHPDRVSCLILWPPPQIQTDTPIWRAGAELAVSDWESFTEFFAHQALGWERGEQSHAYARAMRETVAQETWLRFMAAGSPRFNGPEAEKLYSPARDVRAPTLILQRADYSNFPQFARPIAGAVTRTVQGQGMVPYFGGGGEVIEAIAEFAGRAAGGGRAEATGSLGGDAGGVQGTAVILFTDIAGSTALTERMGDAGFRTASRSVEDRVRAMIRHHGGTAVEGRVLGDGVMGVFTSAARAIAAARECLAVADDLPLHIGLHAGDVIREPGNVYGGAVNIASRICALCEPGEILVSQTVRDLARTSAGVRFADRGEHALKGVQDTLRLYVVQPSG